jgi:hypothetical protein
MASKKPDEKTEDRCPNCGYCPHCGQSTRPPVIPAPYPVPVPARPWQPYRGPYWYGEPKVWSGGSVSTISVSPSTIC